MGDVDIEEYLANLGQITTEVPQLDEKNRIIAEELEKEEEETIMICQTMPSYERKDKKF